jgi:hypothetical protein
MTPRPALAASVFALIVTAVMTGAAQRSPARTAAISGTVTTTSVPPAPLARVLVTLSGDSLKPSQTRITDDQGRFAFQDLPGGNFTLVAARAPYVRTAFGAKRPGRPGTPINLAAGQRVSDVTIPLARGAAITGMVRHPGGEPAPGIQIVATPLDVRIDSPGVPIVTDDRGVYRLFGLPPGRYIVKASVSDRGNAGFSQVSDAEMDRILASLQRRSRLGATSGSSAPGATPSASPSRTEVSTRPTAYGYAPVYYPGTSDPDQAQPVALAEGDERAGVDLDLQLVRHSTIEGRVSMAGEALPSGIQVTLTRAVRGRASDAIVGPATARPDAAGAFRFANVLPGRYRVIARATTMTPVTAAPSANAPGGSSQPATYRTTGVFWAVADITLGDDDLAGVGLTLQRGLKVTGRLAFNAHTLKPPKHVLLRLTEVTGASTFSPSGGGRAGGTFEVSGILPGTYTITSPLSDAGWWLRSVVIDGRDVLDFPLELGGAGDVSGAVATFTDQRTELSGTLQSAASVPAPDYFVVVFSADRTFWRPGSRRVQFTRPGTEGRFVLRDLPAGDYLIAAVTDMEVSDLADSAFMERLVPGALKVHLYDGEKKTQDLRFAK